MQEQSLLKPDWLVVVNPNAGGRRGEKDWPEISRLLKKYGIEYTAVHTAFRGHAIELVLSYIGTGYRKFAVVGGDGTLNEVVNGIFMQERCDPSGCIVGMIPVGTGNDWCRMYRISFTYDKAVQQLQSGLSLVQDIAKVTYFHGGVTHLRYFINVAGMGYDALVCKKTNLMKEKGKGGPLTYLWFVFASLFQFRFMDAVIEVDGNVVFKGEIFSMNVGICRFSGGGMMQVPRAIPDDGLLDITLIRKAPKWMVIRHASKLYNGMLINLPIVRTFRGAIIRMRSAGKIYLETDGESLGHTPFVFQILEKRLQVIVGEKGTW